jgi:hypothetical protein
MTYSITLKGKVILTYGEVKSTRIVSYLYGISKSIVSYWIRNVLNDTHGIKTIRERLKEKTNSA